MPYFHERLIQRDRTGRERLLLDAVIDREGNTHHASDYEGPCYFNRAIMALASELKDAYGEDVEVIRNRARVEAVPRTEEKSDSVLGDEIMDFNCPISCCIMDDPVVAADGFSYDRVMLEELFAYPAYDGRSLLGRRERLNDPNLPFVANNLLKALIEDYLRPLPVPPVRMDRARAPGLLDAFLKRTRERFILVEERAFDASASAAEFSEERGMSESSARHAGYGVGVARAVGEAGGAAVITSGDAVFTGTYALLNTLRSSGGQTGQAPKAPGE